MRYPHWVRFTDLSCDRSPDGSLHVFTLGQSFHPLSSPLQRGVRFFHHPLPTIASGNFYPCLPYQPDAISGLPRSVQATELGRFCLFAGDTNVSVFAPSRQTTDHIEPPTIALGPSSLTTFNSSSLYVNHPTQPSSSFGRNYRTHGKSLAGLAVPRRVATLSERLVDLTVASDAPLLGYKGLNPRSCRPIDAPQDNCLYSLRRCICCSSDLFSPW
jgi:hypothetical protein